MDGMIGSFVIGGVRYPCPGPDVLTFGEAHQIKSMCGIAALPALRAMSKGDSDAMAAFIVVSMRRAGRKVGGIEELFEMQLGGVDFEPAEDEDDAVPPPGAGSSGNETDSPGGDSETTPGPSGTPTSGPSSA
jgi:hypothetical protein